MDTSLGVRLFGGVDIDKCLDGCFFLSVCLFGWTDSRLFWMFEPMDGSTARWMNRFWEKGLFDVCFCLFLLGGWMDRCLDKVGFDGRLGLFFRGGWLDRCLDKCSNGCLFVRVDKRAFRWMDSCLVGMFAFVFSDGWIDGQMFGQTDQQMFGQSLLWTAVFVFLGGWMNTGMSGD